MRRLADYTFILLIFAINGWQVDWTILILFNFWLLVDGYCFYVKHHKPKRKE